jgi:hypothetical protein
VGAAGRGRAGGWPAPSLGSRWGRSGARRGRRRPRRESGLLSGGWMEQVSAVGPVARGGQGRPPLGRGRQTLEIVAGTTGEMAAVVGARGLGLKHVSGPEAQAPQTKTLRSHHGWYLLGASPPGGLRTCVRPVPCPTHATRCLEEQWPMLSDACCRAPTGLASPTCLSECQGRVDDGRICKHAFHDVAQAMPR